jgi:hypothetical protein
MESKIQTAIIELAILRKNRCELLPKINEIKALQRVTFLENKKKVEQGLNYGQMNAIRRRLSRGYINALYSYISGDDMYDFAPRYTEDIIRGVLTCYLKELHTRTLKKKCVLQNKYFKVDPVTKDILYMNVKENNIVYSLKLIGNVVHIKRTGDKNDRFYSKEILYKEPLCTSRLFFTQLILSSLKF